MDDIIIKQAKWKLKQRLVSSDSKKTRPNIQEIWFIEVKNFKYKYLKRTVLYWQRRLTVEILLSQIPEDCCCGCCGTKTKSTPNLDGSSARLIKLTKTNTTSIYFIHSFIIWQKIFLLFNLRWLRNCTTTMRTVQCWFNMFMFGNMDIDNKQYF